MEKLNPKSIENILPLTPLQEGMLFHYLKDPRSGLYFEQLGLEISGAIDAVFFEKAWNVVVQSNEMLRTVFRWEKVEKPSQVILKEHPCQIRLHDFSDIDSSQKETVSAKIKTKDKDEGFDLTGVPFRVTLCKLAETQYEMIVSSHHILYDGWSNGIILKEFFNAYHALTKGEQALPVLNAKSSFNEYIKWLQSQDKNKQEQFWRNYLDGFETATALPVKRKKEEATRAGDYALILGENIQSKLDIFVKNNRVTLASIFYTAWGILLQRYCGSEDIVFGTTVSGRSAGVKGIEGMVGLFINTIPLRIDTHPNEKIINAVIKTDQSLREREVFENTPLVDIVGRDVARNVSTLTRGESLFDTILVIENYPLDDVVRRDVARNVFTVHSYSMVETTHYDLTVGILPFKEIEIKFSFKQELFESHAIENLAGHFKTIIQKVIEQPETALSQLEIISIEEKNRILHEFNNTAADYPTDKTIHQLFVEQAAKTPDHIAVFGHGQTRTDTDNNNDVETLRATSLQIQITYRQLNEQSDHLAGVLIEKGILPDNIIAIKIERSVEMIIGLLGILKSGGAYLPIDPEYPQERIQYILQDSKAKIVVDYEFLKEAPQAPFLQHSAFITQHSNHLCYIIYTSGSTGKPKGVMINHGSVANVLFAVQNHYPFMQADTYLLKTAYTFDVSVTELFGWYMGDMGGGKLAILEKNGEKDPQIIFDWIYRHHVTHINFVPSMFNSFLDFVNEKNKNQLRSLKYIFLAGEALLPSQVKKFADLNTSIALENIYGPTEGTVYSSQYSLSGWNGIDNVPIGKPLANIKLYILNTHNHLQ
ncbi:MAG: condensation domain-containing protein, partial [Acidobacteria bacterium]|nr:condensation domain-containing protein [Acidobacteriota bacterium]